MVDEYFKECEKKIWKKIEELWEEIENIKVPEGKKEEIENLLYEHGHISPSDGSEYAIRVYPVVGEDGFIGFEDENGERVSISEFLKYDLVYDPFILLEWLENLNNDLKKRLGGEKNEN